ncbi:MAG TPA: oxidoreductase, partial [Gemmatimonadales bacterium]|nr:oxidoreductase [Gemmatimonadales bacterium]
MDSPEIAPENAPDQPGTSDSDSLPELTAQLRNAAAFLEAVAANRGLLARVPAADRRRLLDVVAKVYQPDVAARRRLVKETTRLRKAAKAEANESLLHGTGIRELRRKPVFTTPNYFLPEGFEPRDLDDEPEPQRTDGTRHCYVCKEHYSELHHFYDQLCPECAKFNYFKRTELADLTGRVALLTGGRVKIGYQAGLKLLRAGASLIVTTRF